MSVFVLFIVTTSQVVASRVSLLLLLVSGTED